MFIKKKNNIYFSFYKICKNYIFLKNSQKFNWKWKPKGEPHSYA